MLFGGEGVFAKDTGKLIPSTNHCLSLLLPILFRGEKSFMGRETVLGLIIHVRKKNQHFTTKHCLKTGI